MWPTIYGDDAFGGAWGQLPGMSRSFRLVLLCRRTAVSCQLWWRIGERSATRTNLAGFGNVHSALLWSGISSGFSFAQGIEDRLMGPMADLLVLRVILTGPHYGGG